jgi:hypothetical protein
LAVFAAVVTQVRIHGEREGTAAALPVAVAELVAEAVPLAEPEDEDWATTRATKERRASLTLKIILAVSRIERSKERSSDLKYAGELFISVRFSRFFSFHGHHLFFSAPPVLGTWGATSRQANPTLYTFLQVVSHPRSKPSTTEVYNFDLDARTPQEHEHRGPCGLRP